eukprot:359192-Chlamydomonas_euryale.AAC.4
MRSARRSRDRRKARQSGTVAWCRLCEHRGAMSGGGASEERSRGVLRMGSVRRRVWGYAQECQVRIGIDGGAATSTLGAPSPCTHAPTLTSLLRGRPQSCRTTPPPPLPRARPRRTLEQPWSSRAAPSRSARRHATPRAAVDPLNTAPRPDARSH